MCVVHVYHIISAIMCDFGSVQYADTDLWPGIPYIDGSKVARPDFDIYSYDMVLFTVMTNLKVSLNNSLDTINREMQMVRMPSEKILKIAGVMVHKQTQHDQIGFGLHTWGSKQTPIFPRHSKKVGCNQRTSQGIMAQIKKEDAKVVEPHLHWTLMAHGLGEATPQEKLCAPFSIVQLWWWWAGKWFFIVLIPSFISFHFSNIHY